MLQEGKTAQQEEQAANNGRGLTYEEFRKEVLSDYRLAHASRTASVIGRKEVLTGKAKFGIFGDGKEVAQLAMAKAFEPGDFRAGYYRDQTFMFAAGILTIEQFFAQLYANPDPEAEPSSAGRQMNAHFATHSLDDKGAWKDLTAQKNSSADTSPTSSQMARSLGLALASRHYKEDPNLKDFKKFSKAGREVTFATIGDASTAEGLFWETLNAGGVLQVPLNISIWDDGFGISVPKSYQTTKQDIGEMLEGFRRNDKDEGYDIYRVPGYDYAQLCEVYEKAVRRTRKEHIPSIVYVHDVTQPQGHSTSGSHERYKTKERLQWEEAFDCLRKMREWMLKQELAMEKELDQIEAEAKAEAKEAQKRAWQAYTGAINEELNALNNILDEASGSSEHADEVKQVQKSLKSTMNPIRKDVLEAAKHVRRILRLEDTPTREKLQQWIHDYETVNETRFSAHLYSESDESALRVEEVPVEYAADAEEVQGFQVLNKCFDNMLEREPRMVAFGEDLGKLGDVNQGFAGLQKKYGELRVFDTGIREATIIGQGIGMAMRGLRPIAEIQYLDYLIFGLQPLTDDAATLQYRTKGRQKAPLIVRTRGHRLEGIWHTGSPMGMILHALRGMHILVPRNMTQAAGFYNTLLASDDPALVIECLNAYRLREKMPANIAAFKVPLGMPEVLREGTDITLVTYGSCVRVAQQAIKLLDEAGISVELVDVQTLLPFDREQRIVESLKKTNRIVFLDEDVPGGATAYMLREVLEKQSGYYYLDAEPRTITAKPHRAAYASDGDHFSKPNPDDIFEAVYKLMHEADPKHYPKFF